MVLLRRSHRLWPTRRPISAFRQPAFPSRLSHHDAHKPNRPERPTSDDNVLPLGPPSPPESPQHAVTEDLVLRLAAQTECSPERPRAAPTDRPVDVPEDSAVMQELLKQQQDQLQKEKDLRKEEEQLQKKAERKLKAFELLERRNKEPEKQDRAVTWADPVSVAEATAAATATANPPSASLSIPSISTEDFKKRLAEWKTALDKKSRELAQQADMNFSLLGLRVNEVTGYREVELLKEAVKSRGTSLTGNAVTDSRT